MGRKFGSLLFGKLPPGERERERGTLKSATSVEHQPDDVKRVLTFHEIRSNRVVGAGLESERSSVCSSIIPVTPLCLLTPLRELQLLLPIYPVI